MIQKDWDINLEKDSFNTDNSFTSEELDDFDENQDVDKKAPKLQRKITNSKKSFQENILQSSSKLVSKFGQEIKVKIKSETEKLKELREQERKTKLIRHAR